MNVPHVFVELADRRADRVARRAAEAVAPRHAVPFDSTAECVAVVVGPEGGLTAHEATTTGRPAVSPGTTVLHAETAGVVVPAPVPHRSGRVG